MDTITIARPQNAYTQSLLALDVWSANTITFSFPDFGQYTGYADDPELVANFKPISASQKDAVRTVLAQVASYTNLTFVEVTGVTAGTALLRFANSTIPDPAFAYLPSNDPEGGDAWFLNDPDLTDAARGNYGFFTILHEIGHALGLTHPHEPDVGPAMPADRDWMAFTVMSYRSVQNATEGYTNQDTSYAQTFMPEDIAALQTAYGANYNWQSSDTVYKWNWLTGEMSINGAGQGIAAGSKLFGSLWDGNGIDTYDFSGFTSGQNAVIDLRPGMWSGWNNSELHATLSWGNNKAPGFIVMANLANGNAASLIENAIGGAGNDNISGNQLANRLEGGAGDDQLYGQQGDDHLFGGELTDQLFGGDGNDILDGGIGNSHLDGGAGDDLLLGNVDQDYLAGSLGRDILRGEAGNDQLYGGDDEDELVGGAGADHMFGENGNDRLFGGEDADRLEGGNGNDLIEGGEGKDNLFGGWGVDLLTGDAGDDILGGGNDRDRLVGGSGNDLLDGGDGADTLIGGLGNDTYWYTDSADIIIELAGEGEDKIVTVFDIVTPENIEIIELQSRNALSVTGNNLNNTIMGNEADNIIDGGAGADSMGGMMGNDTYHVDNIGDIIGEGVNAGTDTVYASVSFVLRRSYVIPADPNYNPYTGASVRPNVPITVAPVDIERLILTGTANIDATGNEIAQALTGNAGRNILTGAEGNDQIDGGGNVDFAVFTGLRSGYTISQGAVGAFTIAGLDGTDTLVGVEYARFDDALVRLLPGVGTTVNFNTADPATYRAALAGIRDFDGNDLGANDGWLRIGAADVNGDGDADEILINRQIGRFATIGTAADGRVYFSDHGWAGETRVVGTYIDPLVTSGSVAAGSANDSQRRFQNDLQIENINRVLGAGDFDHDGLQEVYFALTDGSAYLHAYMHADGNIRYANYQSEQEMIAFLTENGWGQSTYADWLDFGR